MDNDPIDRLGKFLRIQGWWSDEAEQEFKADARKQVIKELTEAEQRPKPPVRDMFTDVYDGKGRGELPPHLQRQWLELKRLMAAYPGQFPGLEKHLPSNEDDS
jgi:2-oxoisovalerate dehydrogenase E1 component alpha subunit